MKNRYFLTGKVEDPKTGKQFTFTYRQLTAEATEAGNQEGLLYEHKVGRAIETDAQYPFTQRQKITCDDGRVMLIVSVQYITRTINSPVSRYSKPERVAIITLG